MNLSSTLLSIWYLPAPEVSEETDKQPAQRGEKTKYQRPVTQWVRRIAATG
jgi:hypothetical protein